MEKQHKFFSIMFSEWGSGLSGPASVPFAILALFATGSSQKFAYALLAIVLGFFSAYRVWAKENEQREKVETELSNLKQTLTLTPAATRVDVHVSPSQAFTSEAPRIHMRAFQPTLDSFVGLTLDGKTPFPEVQFSLRHLSGRPATSIRITDIVSLNGQFTIRFDLLSFLSGNTEEAVGYEVQRNDGSTSRKAIAMGGRTRFMQDFVFDSRNGEREVHFPFIVWFRDGGEQMSIRLRLIYTFASRKFDIIDDFIPLPVDVDRI